MMPMGNHQYGFFEGHHTQSEMKTTTKILTKSHWNTMPKMLTIRQWNTNKDENADNKTMKYTQFPKCSQYGNKIYINNDQNAHNKTSYKQIKNRKEANLQASSHEMLTMVSSSARVVSLIALYLRAPISAKENLKEGSCFMLLIYFPLCLEGSVVKNYVRYYSALTSHYSPGNHHASRKNVLFLDHYYHWLAGGYDLEIRHL